MFTHRNTYYCETDVWQICIKLLWKIHILQNFEYSECASWKKKQCRLCKFSLSRPNLTRLASYKYCQSYLCNEVRRRMGEAARLPYSISQRTLFLLLKSRSQAQSSDLTCIEMTQEGRYTLCQILAYSRIRKKSKALGFKPRFVEEVQPSQSKTVVLLPQNTLLLWHAHATLALSFIMSILFSSNLISTTIGFFFFSSSPLFLMLSSNEFSIFFCFSPCSVRLSQQKFPVPTITAVMWGQSFQRP